ncbi:hypothetical protein MJH12_06795 [bacterium]|nr:hypothetical protein [bacterium]
MSLLLYGRNHEISKFKSALETHSIILITGTSGIGKTCLVNAAIKDSNFSNSTLHFQCLDDWNLFKLLEEVCLSFQCVDLLDKNRSMETSIDSFLEYLDSLNIVLILDNFNKINAKQTNYFFNQCQTTLNKSKLIIISNNLLSMAHMDLVNLFEIRLKPLAKETSKQLCLELFEAHGSAQPPNPDLILQKLNGHPLFIRYFVSLLAFGQSTITELISQDSILDQYTNKYIHENIWSLLTQQEKNILATLCDVRVAISLTQLSSIFEEGSNHLIVRLIDHFLIDSESTGKLFIDDFLKHFIKNVSEGESEFDYKVDHLRIGLSYSSKDTYLNQDFKESCYHFLRGSHFQEFVTMVSRASDFVILSFFEMEGMLKMIDQSFDTFPQKFEQQLLEVKIKLLMETSDLSKAKPLISQIKNKNKQKLLSTFLLIYEFQYEKAIIPLQTYLSEEKNISFLERINVELKIATALLYAKQFKLADTIIKSVLSIEFKNNYLKSAILHDVSREYTSFDLDKSCEYLQTAISILHDYYPNSELYIYALFRDAGLQFRFFGKIKESLTMIQYANKLYKDLHLSKDFVSGRILEASILLRSANYIETESILSELLTLSSLNTTELKLIYSILGSCQFLLKNFEKAKEYYNINIKLMTKSQYHECFAYLSYMRYLMASKQYDQFIELCNSEHCTGWESFKPDNEAIKLDYLSKCYDLIEDHIKASEVKRESEKIIQKLPKYLKMKTLLDIKWFEETIYKSLSPKFLLVTNIDQQTIGFDQLKRFYQQSSKYDVIIDYNRKEFIVKKSPIVFFSQEKLVRILKEIALAPSGTISSKNLYENCWQQKYNPDIDGALRTCLSRIKNLMKSHLSEPLIISSSRGTYSLNPKLDFCFVFKNDAINS